MKVTWLTQAGLLFDTGKIKIMVDPYLSDAIGDEYPEKKRRIPVDESFLAVNEAQDAVNELMNAVNETITYNITGEQACTHDCSTCGGCGHSH